VIEHLNAEQHAGRDELALPADLGRPEAPACIPGLPSHGRHLPEPTPADGDDEEKTAEGEQYACDYGPCLRELESGDLGSDEPDSGDHDEQEPDLG
jgi:hypothetical protein